MSKVVRDVCRTRDFLLNGASGLNKPMETLHENSRSYTMQKMTKPRTEQSLHKFGFVSQFQEVKKILDLWPFVIFT